MQLLIDQQYLKENSIIDDNVDFDLLTPIIKDVQRLKIKPLLGSDLYNEILTQSTPVITLTADNRTLLDDYILPAMLCYLTSEVPMVLKFRYKNIGVMVSEGDSSTSVDSSELPKLIDYWKNKAEEYGQNMQNFIKAYPALYPAYFTNTGLDKVTPSQSAFNVDIYLEDINYNDGRERI